MAARRCCGRWMMAGALMALVTLGCGGGGGGGGGDGSGDQTIQTGTWTGDADFGQVAFVLIPGSTRMQSLEVTMSDYACGPVTLSGSIQREWTTGLLVTDRQLNVEIDMAPGGEEYLVLGGSFSADGTAVTGTFALHRGTEMCEGSWQAYPVRIGTDVAIEWVERFGREAPKITFEYSGGALTIMVFHQDLRLTGSAGSTQITAAIKDDADAAASLDTYTDGFTLAADRTYELTVRVEVSGWGQCTPFDRDVIRFSSPSAASTSQIEIAPSFNVDRNQWECAGRYAIDEMRMQVKPTN